MSYESHPEYEFFTGVEIKFSIQGKQELEVTLSKLGEHFQQLTIKEGSLSGDNQLTSPNANNIASGKLDLYDENNLIFNSLLASYSASGETSGSPLVNTVDITLNTYTGSRHYKGRVDSWSCSFSDGVPIISLEWQQIPSDSQPSTSNPQKPSFDSLKAKELLVDKGVKDFEDFTKAITSIFNTQYSFVYSPTKEYPSTGLLAMDYEDGYGKLKIFNEKTGDEGVTGYIFIPESCKSKHTANGDTFSMELTGNTDNFSFLCAILSEFCKTAKITLTKGTEKDNLCLGYRILDDKILLFSFTDLSRQTMPQPMGTTEILNSVVFVYNSSLTQGSLYTTPQGDKRVFVVEDLNTTFKSSDIIKSYLNDQSNVQNPNGNFVITSRGAITVPANVPQALSQAIQNLAALSLQQSFQVNITVYNFIHFYCLGETPVYLIAFDHLGNVHPLSGRMRVGAYTYTLGLDGVIKADVTLIPLLNANVEDFVAPIVGTLSSSSSDLTQSSLPTSSYNTEYGSSEYPYDNTNQQGSYVKTGMTLDSAVDYTINKGE